MGLFQPEVEYTYQLELEAGMIPTPSDSEVESFVMYRVDGGALERGAFQAEQCGCDCLVPLLNMGL